MSFTFNGFILGGGGIDGNMDGLPDGLEFGFKTNPASSLIGGAKTTDSGGALDALGAGSVTIISGATASDMVGSGVNSVCIGHDVKVSGASSVGIGCTTLVTGVDAVGIGPSAIASAASTTAVGKVAAATFLGACAYGNNATASGLSSTALGGGGAGAGPTASGDHTFCVGAQMQADIDETWIIRGFGTVARALALTEWERISGPLIAITSPLSNGLSANDQRLDFPVNVHFYCESVDILVVNLDGTIDTQATVRAGNRDVADVAGDNEFYFPATLGIDLDTVFDRDVKAALANQLGVRFLSGDVSTAGAIGGGSATVYELRFVFNGKLIRDE